MNKCINFVKKINDSFFFKGVIGSLCFLCGVFLSPQHQISSDLLEVIKSVMPEMLIFGCCLALASYINGHNERMFMTPSVDYIVNVLVASLIGCFLAILLIYWFSFSLVGRWVAFITLIIYFCASFCLSLILVAWGSDRLRILTFDKDAVIDAINDLNGIILNPKVEIVAFDRDCIGGSDFKNKIAGGGIDYIIIARCVENSKLAQMINYEEFLSSILSLNRFFEAEFGLIYPLHYCGTSWWDVETKLRCSQFATVKRFIDVLMVLVLSVPAALVVLIAGAVIKISDGGAVFYKQKRLGQFARPFTIFKLRTMVLSSEANGAQWAVVGDSRVTRIGKILRRSRIDELPQLWNILIGDMSLVGPRPERPEFYSVIEDAVKEFGLRLAVKPGLTGWAQINYPYGSSIRDSRNKLLYDLYYIKNAGFLLDLRIMTRTIVAMVKGSR